MNINEPPHVSTSSGGSGITIIVIMVIKISNLSTKDTSL